MQPASWKDDNFLHSLQQKFAPFTDNFFAPFTAKKETMYKSFKLTELSCYDNTANTGHHLHDSGAQIQRKAQAVK